MVTVFDGMAPDGGVKCVPATTPRTVVSGPAGHAGTYNTIEAAATVHAPRMRCEEMNGI